MSGSHNKKSMKKLLKFCRNNYFYIFYNYKISHTYISSFFKCQKHRLPCLVRGRSYRIVGISLSTVSYGAS
jgi:hypothetical protein